MEGGRRGGEEDEGKGRGEKGEDKGGGGRARRIDANYPPKKSQAPGVIGNIERFLTEGSGEGGGSRIRVRGGEKG